MGGGGVGAGVLHEKITVDLQGVELKWKMY